MRGRSYSYNGPSPSRDYGSGRLRCRPLSPRGGYRRSTDPPSVLAQPRLLPSFQSIDIIQGPFLRRKGLMVGGHTQGLLMGQEAGATLDLSVAVAVTVYGTPDKSLGSLW